MTQTLSRKISNGQRSEGVLWVKCDIVLGVRGKQRQGRGFSKTFQLNSRCHSVYVVFSHACVSLTGYFARIPAMGAIRSTVQVSSQQPILASVQLIEKFAGARRQTTLCSGLRCCKQACFSHCECSAVSTGSERHDAGDCSRAIF